MKISQKLIIFTRILIKKNIYTMTEQEVNNLIDSKIGKVKMSQLPETDKTGGLYSIGYNGNHSVKYKANLLQGDPLTVRKTYQTEAEALADKNPIDPTTSLPLTVGQFVSIVDDGEKNGIYRIGSISGDGTMALELQGKLGDLSGYTKTGGSTKTTKEVEDDLAQLAGEKQDKSEIDDILIKSIGGWGAKFNGVNSMMFCDDILISQIGDFIEFDIENISSSSFSGGYSFAGIKGSTLRTSIAVSKEGVLVRDINNSWTIAPADQVSLSNYPKRLKVKIERNNDGVSLYYNDELVVTKPFTGNILIQRFGDSYSSDYGFWEGIIYSVTTNIGGVIKSGLMTHLSGAEIVNIDLVPPENRFLTEKQVSDISRNNLTSELVSKMSPTVLSIINRPGDTNLSRVFLDPFIASNIGDFIEVRASSPEYTPLNSANLCLFLSGVAPLTYAGLYNNAFYLRSYDTTPEAYKIWSFPADFDPTILHTYKLQIVENEAEEKNWELIVDGISWGLRAFTNAVRVHFLGSYASGTEACGYNYEYLKLKSTTIEKCYSANDLYALSNNGNLMLEFNYEKVIDNSKRISIVERGSDDLQARISNITYIYTSDLYFSSYNRDATAPSSTILDKVYSLQNVGDFFEIKARYWGDRPDYTETLNLVGGASSNSRFGWYSPSEIWFRANNEGYSIWAIDPLVVIREEWHTYKLIVVEAGIELFIDNVSMGVRELDTSNFTVYKIAPPIPGTAYVQKYDIKYFIVNSETDGELTLNPPALYNGSINVDLMTTDNSTGEVTANLNPLCFVSYNSVSKTFNVYLRDSENQNDYYGFVISLQSSRGTSNDPIFFTHCYRLTRGSIWKYNPTTNNLINTGISTIASGESECVFMCYDINGAKVDHSGGVHGDETIDVKAGDFASFYIDGVRLTEAELATSFDLRPCSEFKYIQKSSIHETAYYENNVDTELAATGAGDLTLKNDTRTFVIDGVDTGIIAYSQNGIYPTTQSIIDAGITLSKSAENTWLISKIIKIYDTHPIIAKHLKKSTMSGQTFKTENTLIFNNTRELAYWYAGIYCLGKGVATFGHNEDYEEVEFTGSGSNFLSKNEDNYRLFEAYNPTTGCSAIVKNWITENGNGVIYDDSCDMFVWDRVSDSKYYRSTGSFTPVGGERLTSVTEVEYNKKSD